MNDLELTQIPVDTGDGNVDRRSSLAFVPDAQWDDFEDDIVKLTKAHADCRDLNNVMDRLLRVGAMLLSFATTALVATRENTEEDEVTAPTFAECVMSGGVSLLAGLCRLLLLLLLFLLLLLLLLLLHLLCRLLLLLLLCLLLLLLLLCLLLRLHLL